MRSDSLRAIFVSLLVVGAAALVALENPASTRAVGDGGPIVIPLRVLTPSYELGADGLSVVGYELSNVPGAPRLPVWQSVVELPSAGEWRVEATALRTERLSTREPLPSMPVPSPVRGPDGPRPESLSDIFAVEAIGEIEAPDSAIYGADALYPASRVLAGPDQWQAGKRYLPVRVFPFQYNPVSGEILYAPDIEVTVTLIPSGEGEPIEASAPMLNEAAQAIGSAGAMRINVRERGITRLTYADLTGTGVPAAQLTPSGLAMTNLGQPVAIEIIGGEDNSFDPGDSILFYAEPFESRWSAHNVYWLSYGGATGARVTTRSFAQSGATVSSTLRRARIEAQQLYFTEANRPTSEDHIFYQGLSPNRSSPSAETVTRDYPISLVAPGASGTATLRVRLQGRTDFAPNPDHSVELKVNGTSGGVFQWNGNNDYLSTATVPQSALQHGNNTITLVAAMSQFPNAPELFSYTVFPDWFEIEYTGATQATDGRLYLERIADGQNHVVVTGFSGTPAPLSRVYDVRNPKSPVRVTSVQSQPGTIAFWDQPLTAPSYAVSSDVGFLAPLSIVLDTPSTLQSPANQASYIAIYHASLKASLTPLLDHRQAEGFQVARVDVQDIYDEFNFGIPDQEALRTFLTYAYANWNGSGLRPQYVFIVGDANFDFRGETPGTSMSHNLVPPYFAHVDPFMGEAAADNRYVSVNGPDDYLPDMHLGRLSAHSPISVTNYVDKVLAYESAAPAPWQTKAVYLADNDQDPAGNFHLLQDHLRLQWLPATYDSQRIYLDPNMNAPGPGTYPTGPLARDATWTAFNEGSLTLQFFGHANRRSWATQTMLHELDIPGSLTPNDRWPVVVHYSCWSSNYLFQDYGDHQSLSENLTMRAPMRGSIGDIGPTGFHVGSALLALGQGLQESMFREGQNRLGAVADDARYYFFENSISFHDTIDTTLVTGDPALKLKLPAAPRHTTSTLTDAPDPVAPGADLTYTVTAVNSGTATSANTVITLDYDQTRGAIQPGHGGTDNGDTVTWSNITVGVGQQSARTATFRVNANVPLGQTIAASASIGADWVLPTELDTMTTVGLGPTATPTPITPTLTPTPITPTLTPTPITPTATPSTPTATATVPPSTPRLYLPLVVR